MRCWPVLVLAVGGLTAVGPWRASLSRPLIDAQVRALAPQAPPAGTLVVDIDDASLMELEPSLGGWPYARGVHAAVVTALREAGARAIAINLLLVDGRPGDEALAQTLRRPGAPVVLAAAALRQTTPVGDAATAAAPGVVAPGAAVAAAPPVAERWPALLLPAAPLREAATVGVITVRLDDDGMLRRLPLWHDVGGRRLPAMPLALWLASHPDQPLPDWPHDAAGRVAVALHPGEVSSLPFTAVARVALGLEDGTALARTVRGAVVLIGSSATQADAVMTLGGQLSGTQVMAQAYAALRDGTLLRESGRPAQALLWLLALAPALAMAWRGRAVPGRDGALALVALAALAAAVVAGIRAGSIAQPAAPLLMLLAGFVGSVVLHQRVLAADRRRLAWDQEVARNSHRAKTDFLAHVSHEMRTPLNALLGVAELLAAGPLTGEQRRQVSMLREAGGNLQGLIDDLLDLAKIEAERFELDTAPFALADPVARVMRLMRPRAELKGLQLGETRSPALPEVVSGDARRLTQALLNLVANAVKFTTRGSVSVRVEPDAARPGHVRFSVADSGIGIAHDQIEAIFEPFAQADDGITRRFGGTGLGLSIARRIARLMDGDVEVASKPGRGSVFTLTVRLPAAELPAMASTTLPSAPSASSAPPMPSPPPAADAALPPAPLPPAAAEPRSAVPVRVLLAEDNAVNAYLFEAMMADLPVRIETVGDGLAALAALRERRHDIAFLDVQMPGMDGLTVTRELRRFEAGTAHGLPVVALTANAFDSDVALSRAAGCDRHVSKPFSKDDLRQALRELLPGRMG